MGAFSVVCVTASMLGWINTILGVILTLVFAIGAAVLISTLMGKHKNCSIVFLGLSGGFFFGSLIYMLIYAISGF